jgi:hypothetical protein
MNLFSSNKEIAIGTGPDRHEYPIRHAPIFYTRPNRAAIAATTAATTALALSNPSATASTAAPPASSSSSSSSGVVAPADGLEDGSRRPQRHAAIVANQQIDRIQGRAPTDGATATATATSTSSSSSSSSVGSTSLALVVAGPAAAAATAASHSTSTALQTVDANANTVLIKRGPRGRQFSGSAKKRDTIQSPKETGHGQDLKSFEQLRATQTDGDLVPYETYADVVAKVKTKQNKTDLLMLPLTCFLLRCAG